VVTNTWFGLFAPAGTPDPAVRAIHREVAKALADPKVRESLLGLGLMPNGASPEEFEKILAVDFERAAKLVKASAIKPDQ
jgi:tripartite-type tricarboxylate transporter receptor subunit TctC